MNAIDTNVLIRIIVQDNEIQASKALQYVKKSREVFICAIVLCEVTWVLESSYKLSKSQIIDIIEKILSTNQFIIEHSEAAWLGLNEFKRINADFSDCFIGAIIKHHGHHPVATFDKKAAKSKLFTLIR